MKQVEEVLKALSGQLAGKAAANAVVGKMVSAADCHVLPLCEISVGLGAGGGQGVSEGNDKGEGQGSGTGGGAGGSAKVRPVAVLVVDGQGIRVERLG